MSLEDLLTQPLILPLVVLVSFHGKVSLTLSKPPFPLGWYFSIPGIQTPCFFVSPLIQLCLGLW